MANMGVVPPADGYLEQMRKIADEYGILLILDETVTGFRVAQGGCQELYGIEADIATFGKALGSGLPVAAITGKATIMEALSWGGVLHFGTQNASRLGLHVARASLSELCRNKGKALHRVWELGEGLCSKLRDLFEEEGARAIVQNVGPMFQIMFTGAEQIRDYRDFCRCIDREKYQRFVLALFEKGIYMTPAATLHSVVTVAHSEEHVDYTLGAVREALRDVQ
jgi:glutamate-1-semialdehyde 2,1-aminomutase